MNPQTVTSRMLGRLVAVTVAIAAAGVASVAIAQTQPRYTMADLQKLGDQGAWQELSGRLGDIAPSARNKAWDALAEKSAIGLLRDATKSQQPREDIAIAEGMLKQYPGLGQSRPFMSERATVGIEAFRQCFRDSYNGEWCLRELDSFVAVDATNGDLAYRAGKLARLNLRDWTATPFFDAAITNNAALATICADNDVLLAVKAAMYLPEFDNNKKFRDAGVKLAGTHCWTQIGAALVTEIKDGNACYFKNACPTLRTRDGTDAAVIKACAPS